MPKPAVPIDQKSCEAMLAEIEAELVKAIVAVVRKRKIKERTYGLLVCYIDLTTDEYLPFVVVLPESFRLKCVANREADRIWRLPEMSGVEQLVPAGTALARKCNFVYEYLSEDWKDQDEERVILPFRKMIYRVCLHLNDLDWSAILPVTEDFAVVASDWSGFWVHEDAEKSVPPARKRLLKKQGLFFNSEKLPEPKVEPGNPIKRMGKQPAEVQLPYWIAQLEAIANGEECDASRAKWGIKRVVSECTKLGDAGGDALLGFVERCADQSEWKSGQPGNPEKDLGPRSEALRSALDGVEISCRKDDATEKRLWAIFETAIKVNKGCKTWGNLPAAAAFAIYHMYNAKYKFWVIRDSNNVVKSLDEIRKAQRDKAPR